MPLTKGTWLVCGPPRSGTTFMLESLVARTDLILTWDASAEWASRDQTGHEERFYEPALPLKPKGRLVKVLDPDGIPAFKRAILMIREPAQVVASAQHIGIHISESDVVERQNAFVTALGDKADLVHLYELADLDTLFDRLASTGWPVLPTSHTFETRAVR